jgi:hypothetical protein
MSSIECDATNQDTRRVELALTPSDSMKVYVCTGRGTHSMEDTFRT